MSRSGRPALKAVPNSISFLKCDPVDRFVYVCSEASISFSGFDSSADQCCPFTGTQSKDLVERIMEGILASRLRGLQVRQGAAFPDIFCALPGRRNSALSALSSAECLVTVKVISGINFLLDDASDKLGVCADLRQLALVRMS